jgi:glycosyltransferase involved in cell wall biosynthesis
MINYAVAIPAYNAARTIAETLASVLDQTVPPSDVVVVDDGSNDNTADIVAQTGGCVRLIRQDNAGCGAATNAAVNATTAPLVAMIDADDIWVADKMERQLARLQQVGARTLLFTKSRQFKHGEADRSTGIERDNIGRSTLLMHRAAFDEIGPIIDPPGGCGDMVDWVGRARDLDYSVEVMPDVLMLRRIISGSMTFGMNEDMARGYLSVARAAILRRRQAEHK